MITAAKSCSAARLTGWKRSIIGLRCLEGFIVAFLNLDRVIDIIRYDDDPKAALMREDWSKTHVRAMDEKDYVSPAPGEGELSEVQVEAILNMRLRSLRRLEEIGADARAVRADGRTRMGLEDLLASDDLQWEHIIGQLRETKKQFGKDYDGGARRTSIEEAAEVEDVPLEAMIDREPITVVCSKWAGSGR